MRAHWTVNTVYHSISLHTTNDKWLRLKWDDICLWIVFCFRLDFGDDLTANIDISINIYLCETHEYLLMNTSQETKCIFACTIFCSISYHYPTMSCFNQLKTSWFRVQTGFRCYSSLSRTWLYRNKRWNYFNIVLFSE